MSESSFDYLSQSLDCIDPAVVAEALDEPPRRRIGIWLAAAAAVCAFAVGAAVWSAAVSRSSAPELSEASQLHEAALSEDDIAGGYEGGAANGGLDAAHLDRLIEVSEVIVIGSPAAVTEGSFGDNDLFSAEPQKTWSAIAVERVLKGTAVPDTVLLTAEKNSNGLHLEAEPFVPQPETGRYIWFLAGGSLDVRELIEYIPQLAADGSENSAYAYVLAQLE